MVRRAVFPVVQLLTWQLRWCSHELPAANAGDVTRWAAATRGRPEVELTASPPIRNLPRPHASPVPRQASLIQSASQAVSETQEKIRILENELEVLRRESLSKDKALVKVRRPRFATCPGSTRDSPTSQQPSIAYTAFSANGKIQYHNTSQHFLQIEKYTILHITTCISLSISGHSSLTVVVRACRCVGSSTTSGQTARTCGWRQTACTMATSSGRRRSRCLTLLARVRCGY